MLVRPARCEQHVLDASAGIELVLRTEAGRSLAAQMSFGEPRWVPEHFYAPPVI